MKAFFSNGAEFGEEGVVLELDVLMCRVADLRRRTLLLFGDINDPHRHQHRMGSDYLQDPKSMAAEARTLDAALEAWADHLPSDWKLSIQPLPSSTSSSSSSSISSGNRSFLYEDEPIYTYASHGHATAWNRYRAVRLIVNSIRLQLLAELSRQPLRCPEIGSEVDACRRNTDVLATELCRSVPFFFTLQPAGSDTSADSHAVVAAAAAATEPHIIPKMGGLLAWPLTVAVSTEAVPAPQRQWLRRTLKTAAAAMGDAVLESVADRGGFKF